MAPIDKIYAVRKTFSRKEYYPERDPVEVVWTNRIGAFFYKCRSQLFEDDGSIGTYDFALPRPLWRLS
jgi:hypothetical protein